MNTEDKIRTVRTIVFEDWDPVGFGPVLPVDEYDTSIRGIIHLLENHCSAEQLEAHLLRVEKDWFGVVQDGGKAHLAAKDLVASWPAYG